MTDHGAHDDHSHGQASHDHGGDGHGHAAHDDGGHGHHDHSHGGHDEHDDHGHGHEHWGDYNSQPQPPSALPPVSPISLAVMGAALGALLLALVGASFRLSTGRTPVSQATAERAAHGEEHEHKHE